MIQTKIQLTGVDIQISWAAWDKQGYHLGTGHFTCAEKLCNLLHLNRCRTVFILTH